ncbi:MAG: hypothetical protein AAF636_03010 [Pseudomonadota bacterium]
MKAGILLAALAAIASVLWFSDILSPQAGEIRVSGAMAHQGRGDEVNAVLTIKNDGAPDELLSVSSPDAHVAFRGVGSGLPVQTGVSSLSMDAAHIRISPTTPPEEGALLPLTLTFAQAGEINVKARFMTPDPGSMDAHMAMGHTMMFEPAKGEPAPIVSLLVTSSGQGWTAHIATQNFIFSEELQDGEHVAGTGHGHIYAGDLKLGRVFANTYDIGALPKGSHIIRVSLNTNNHRTYSTNGQPVEATATIIVD